jgi:hypothetical protein
LSNNTTSGGTSATPVADQPMRASEFVARQSGSLRGFAMLQLPSGIIFIGVAFHVREGRTWAMPPSKPRLGRDGAQMVGADQKKAWDPIIGFASKPIRDRWSAEAVAALLAAYPNALDSGDGS